MSMTFKGIERNKLDYILTDLLPVELSELFSYNPFYEFLTDKAQQRTLFDLTEELKKSQAKGTNTMFQGNWATIPLKYNILKGSNALREMSLVQPLSVLNLYLFIECYQKDILNFFDYHHCYSIRYHKKTSDLYYKSRLQKAIEYFQKDMRCRIGKAAVQQTGKFFKIIPFESINAFSDSRLWHKANFDFKYYAKIDYKSCFDSIYSHVYKWIIERNTIDSKEAKNSNLFITIDRILQNINGRQSNGLIVGPEFSRMVAEILLQQIDTEVYNELLINGISKNKDYTIFRYVDDIFIFADSEENINKIVKTFTTISNRYKLQLNELKILKSKTPCLPKAWLERTRILADVIDNFFDKHKKSEYDKLQEEKKFIVKKDYFPIDRLKDEFVTLMNEFPANRHTIVSFLLSTLLNNIGKIKDGYRLFAQNNIKKALLLIDLALFIYAFSPTFDSTRKIISMIVYMSDEFNFKLKDSDENTRLKNVILRYAFIFERGNLSDICDWFPFFIEYNIALDVITECEVINNAEQINNPIIWANLLMYSQYHPSFFNEVKTKIETVLEVQIARMINKEYMMQTEFWYVIVFHNCPYINSAIQNKMTTILDNIEASANSAPQESFSKATTMVCDFLKRTSPNGNKPLESFYNWSNNRNISSQITYRTFQRTIFRRYRKNRYSLYASIE